MDDLKNNKMIWILAVVTMFNIGAFFISKVVVDKAADRVIQKLKKEYSPSPYGPGFDPDKVNPEAFKSSKKFLDSKKDGQSMVFPDEKASGDKVFHAVAISDVWRNEWEGSRINP